MAEAKDNLKSFLVVPFYFACAAYFTDKAISALLAELDKIGVEKDEATIPLMLGLQLIFIVATVGLICGVEFFSRLPLATTNNSNYITRQATLFTGFSSMAFSLMQLRSAESLYEATPIILLSSLCGIAILWAGLSKPSNSDSIWDLLKKTYTLNCNFLNTDPTTTVENKLSSSTHNDILLKSMVSKIKMLSFQCLLAAIVTIALEYSLDETFLPSEKETDTMETSLALGAGGVCAAAGTYFILTKKFQCFQTDADSAICGETRNYNSSNDE